jgi:hypothetical protein
VSECDLNFNRLSALKYHCRRPLHRTPRRACAADRSATRPLEASDLPQKTCLRSLPLIVGNERQLSRLHYIFAFVAVSGRPLRDTIPLFQDRPRISLEKARKQLRDFVSIPLCRQRGGRRAVRGRGRRSTDEGRDR